MHCISDLHCRFEDCCDHHDDFLDLQKQHCNRCDSLSTHDWFASALEAVGNGDVETYWRSHPLEYESTTVRFIVLSQESSAYHQLPSILGSAQQHGHGAKADQRLQRNTAACRGQRILLQHTRMFGRVHAPYGSYCCWLGCSDVAE